MLNIDSFTTGSLTVVDVGDKLAKALELSIQLSLQKSLEGAIKVVNAMRLPSLAERLSLILEVGSTILLSYTLSLEQMLPPLLA
jgi:chromosome transmission fidelity protein 4